MQLFPALLLASPWIVGPTITILRARRSSSLDDLPATPHASPATVSVIIPARDEARNIARCVRSILASDYPSFEILVVDDHSRDGTGDIARDIAAHDARVRVITNEPLPPDWFGKQWACATGANAATGELLLFTDADTTHAPDLLPRAVNALHDRHADLLSVAGRQEFGSFWERVVQPHVFWLIASRYGGTESVNRSRRGADKIANGQYILVRRDAYLLIGGHGAVRHVVAEDVRLAQLFHARSLRPILTLGLEQLSTRMYTSLPELVRGWRKNVFAGGRDAMPFGLVGQLLFPMLLLLFPLMALLPVAVAILAAIGIAPTVLLPGALIAIVFTLIVWLGVYTRLGLSPLYALTYPLGSFVFFLIAAQAVASGANVEWKGRRYVSGEAARL